MGLAPQVDLTLKNLAMATTFYHQRNKAKGFCNWCEFNAWPITLCVCWIEFNYVGLFHFVSLKDPEKFKAWRILNHNCELLQEFFNLFFMLHKNHKCVYNSPMNILDIAIKVAGGTKKLALMLDVKQNVVSNWRQRGVPKSWEQVLKYKFKKQIAEAQKAV